MDFLVSKLYVKNAPKSDFEADLQIILDLIKAYYPDFSEVEIIKVKHAFYYAEQAHKGQNRKSGIPYFTHPIEATKILLTIQPDILTICACLLHDVIEDTPITAQDIRTNFGTKVAFFCEGVEKVTKVKIEQENERQHESLRKLFISMAEDIRVIFIKLADRIHNLSTLDALPRKAQIRIANESLSIYAVVADKLGLSTFKNQIEDACFKYLHPDIYNNLTEQTTLNFSKQITFIENGKKEILKLLHKEGIETVQILGRNKHLYSIYKKMKRKNFTTINEIYDLIALRIIVKEESDCYRTMGLLHRHWKPIISRFKDYISVPKNNGYQSLHITLLGLAQNPFPTEIQIRTEAMNLDAEFGPAAHWAYKKSEGSSFDEAYLKKFNWLSSKIKEADSNQSSTEFFEEITRKISLSRIHVFTPKGDVKDLVIKSTPVDLAYAIHSDIGDSCVGAKVNGVIKPLNFELKTGDVVEIMTKKGRAPNPLWLKFVKSSAAKSNIKGYINSIKENSTEFDLAPNTQKNEDPKDEKISTQKNPTKNKAKKSAEKQPKSKKICIGGETNIPFKIATCCHPKNPDEIIAYSSRGLEFSIHNADCSQLIELDSARFLDAKFMTNYYFSIDANERAGLLGDYSIIIKNLSINIIDAYFKLVESKSGPISHWNFIVETSSKKRFDELLEQLEKVPNVIAIIDNTNY